MQETVDLSAEILAELRKINHLLFLAFADPIERRIKSFLEKPGARTVLTALTEGEKTTDSLLSTAKDGGIARSTFFNLVAELERSGMIERPRRGYLKLSSIASPYVPAPRKAKEITSATPQPISAAVEPGSEA